MTRPSEKEKTRGTAAVQQYVPPGRGAAAPIEGQTEDHLANVKKALDANAEESKANETEERHDGDD